MTSILPTPSYWDHICHLTNPLHSPQLLRLEGDHSPLFPLSQNPNSPFPQRGDIHLRRHKATLLMDEDFPITLQEESSKPKKGRTTDWLTYMESDHVQTPLAGTSYSIKEARAHYFATHSWDWDHSNTEDLSDIFKELAQEAGLLGESIFDNTMVMEGAGAFTAGQLHFPVSTQGA